MISSLTLNKFRVLDRSSSSLSSQISLPAYFLPKDFPAALLLLGPPAY